MLDYLYWHSGEAIMIGLTLVFLMGAQFILGCSVYSVGWTLGRRLGAWVTFWLYNLLAIPSLVLISISWFLVPSLLNKIFGFFGLPHILAGMLSLFICFKLYSVIALFSTSAGSITGLSDLVASQFRKSRFEDDVFLSHCTKSVFRSMGLTFILMMLAQVVALHQLLS